MTRQPDPRRFDHLRPGWRAAATAWAKSMIGNPDVLWLDTETTAADPKRAEIVDIAVVGPAGNVKLDTLVRPPNPIPDDAAAIHGITNDLVVDALTWPELYPGVRSLLLDRDVVIYNGEYDFQVIQRACREAGLPEIPFRFQCCMLAYSDWVGELGRYPPQRKWHKLGAAAQQFGIEVPGHRALEDAETCRQVVVAMAKGVS